MLFLRRKVISIGHLLNKCYNSLRSPIVIRGPVHFQFELRLRQTRCSCVCLVLGFFEHQTITSLIDFCGHTLVTFHWFCITQFAVSLTIVQQSILFKKLLPLPNRVKVLFGFSYFQPSKDFENMELPVNTVVVFCFTLCACAFGLHTMNVDMVPHQQSVWILLIFKFRSRPPEQWRKVTRFLRSHDN